MNKLIVCIFALGAVSVAMADPVNVPYPEGYRDWRHVKSMVIQPGHPLYGTFGGIHHLYANAKAMQGYKTGKFPNGSVIVFDLLDAVNEGNAVTGGDRKIVGVMHKQAKRHAATGGWGFEGFKGDSKTERVVGNNAATACYQCHTQQSRQDFVFSRSRDR